MKKRILLIVALLLLALVAWVVWGNLTLQTTWVRVDSARLPKAFDGYRIAQVSDLHDARFGRDNRKLIEKVRAAEPDIIVLTGDFIDSTRLDIEGSVRTAQGLMEVAPVYYVSGNHEAKIRYRGYKDLIDGLKEAGVVVLEDQTVDLEKDGEVIQLIGLRDIGFHSGKLAAKEGRMADALAQMLREDAFSLVLTHRPELIRYYRAAGADLVLAGHAHGGQFRVPFLGGVYAPGQGLFPEYTSGIYQDGSTVLVVSRGVGNSRIPVRVNNPPEIVVVELRAA